MKIHIPVITPPPDLGKSAVIGSAVLRDHTGKEVNLDGTQKLPYRHPHFGQGQHQSRPEDLANMQHTIAVQTMVNREPVEQLAETSRQQLLNLPSSTSLNLQGKMQTHGIQTIEQYFDSAIIPLEQRTEIAIAYFKREML